MLILISYVFQKAHCVLILPPNPPFNYRNQPFLSQPPILSFKLNPKIIPISPHLKTNQSLLFLASLPLFNKMNTQTIVMLIAVICTLVCSVSAAEDNSSNGTGFAVVTGGSSPIVMLTAALIPLVARYFA